MSPLELLAAVNGFYEQAFNRLLATTFGTIAFIGVLVPIVVGWVQVRSLRQEKGSLLNELRAEINDERASVRDAIEASVREEMRGLQNKLESRIEELTNDLARSSSLAEARSFHLQGLNSFRSKRPHHAIKDFVTAAVDYIKGHSEANAQRCMNLISDDCLPKINKDQYSEMKIEKSCNELIEKLREINEHDRYSDHIHKIEVQMEKASSRAPTTEKEGGA